MSSSKLFAFNLAKPVALSTEEIPLQYDPQTQTSLWQGGNRPLAARCRTGGSREHCNSYGSYCSTWGSFIPNGYGYRCG